MKIHNFVSLYDLVPRLLGQHLPDTVKIHLQYAVKDNLSFIAENFAPFGHFHVLSQNQMRTTFMNSQSNAEPHVLKLSQHEEKTLADLIFANSLEGVILLAHAMTGYIKELEEVLKSCSKCSLEQDGAEYQAILCHKGESVAGFTGQMCKLPVPFTPLPALCTF